MSNSKSIIDNKGNSYRVFSHALYYFKAKELLIRNSKELTRIDFPQTANDLN
jgi:mRNA-degrading endonuclease HigB of HigAB toxin-antitoxin module